MMIETLGVGVQVSSAVPGVSPVAFLAVVEVINGDGEKHYVTIASDGCSDQRRATLAAALESA